MRTHGFSTAVMLVVVWVSIAPVGTAEGEPVVESYYCPWYGTFPGGHAFRDTLRDHLQPSQRPEIGAYSRRDAAVSAAHLDQSHLGNIDVWAVNWWGPASPEDVTWRGRFCAQHPSRRWGRGSCW